MLFNNNSYKTNPSDDEVEVAVFGAGFGEAIAIHIGEKRWILIDSCKFPNDDRPVSLRYLDDLAISPKSVLAM